MLDELASTARRSGIDLAIFAHPFLLADPVVSALERQRESASDEQRDLIDMLRERSSAHELIAMLQAGAGPFESLQRSTNRAISSTAAHDIARSAELAATLTPKAVFRLEAQIVQLLDDGEVTTAHELAGLLRSSKNANPDVVDPASRRLIAEIYARVAANYLAVTQDIEIHAAALEEIASLRNDAPENQQSSVARLCRVLEARVELAPILGLRRADFRAEWGLKRTLTRVRGMASTAAKGPRAAQRLEFVSSMDIEALRPELEELAEGLDEYSIEARYLLCLVLRWEPDSVGGSESSLHRIRTMGSVVLSAEASILSADERLRMCRLVLDAGGDIPWPFDGLLIASDSEHAAVQRLVAQGDLALAGILDLADRVETPLLLQYLKRSTGTLGSRSGPRSPLAGPNLAYQWLVESQLSALSDLLGRPEVRDRMVDGDELLDLLPVLALIQDVQAVRGRGTERERTEAESKVDTIPVSPLFSHATLYFFLASECGHSHMAAQTAGDFSAAVNLMGREAWWFLKAHMVDLAVEAIISICLICEKHVPPLLQNLTGLMQLAPIFASVLGSPGQNAIQGVWLAELAKTEGHDHGTELLFAVAQLLSNWESAVWRVPGAENIPMLDQEQIELREVVDEMLLEAHRLSGPVHINDATEVSNEQLLSSTYYESGAPNPGYHVNNVYENLEHFFGVQIVSSMERARWRYPVDVTRSLIPLYRFQERLPADTAVVLVAIDGEHRPNMLILRGGEAIPVRLDGVYDKLLVIGATYLDHNELAVLSARCQARGLFEGDFLERSFPLAELADALLPDSIRRIAVVPAGPYHLMPFHLAESNGVPVATDRIVSVAPSISALYAAWDGGSPKETEFPSVASFGIARFPAVGALQMADLPRAEAEAQFVAGLFGAKAVCGTEATVEEVVTAMTSKPIVHVATHGDMRPHAPWRQSLFLFDEQGSIGRLTADRVALLPLESLRLVTLSGCETGVGRVDAGGNHMGLVAALLRAGAGNVIATLWRVSDDCAATFFGAFYEALQATRDIGHSYRRAQLLTRSQFVNRREWGAFSLYGPPDQRV